MGFMCIFSHGAMMKKINNSLKNDEIPTFYRLLVVQAIFPKVYKRTTTSSSNYYCAH
jgi:hypothetical protein